MDEAPRIGVMVDRFNEYLARHGLPGVTPPASASERPEITTLGPAPGNSRVGLARRLAGRLSRRGRS